MAIKPTQTGLGRAFVAESLGCGKGYVYQSCLKVDALSKSFGDVTAVYCPSDDTYNEFVEIASIKGADSRATSTLSSVLPIDRESVLERLANLGCSFSLQVHYGQCTRPNSFTQFDSAIVFKDVKLTSYDLTTLTARTPDERAVVEESSAISIGDYYRIFDISLANVAEAEITAIIVPFGVVNIDSKSCGDNCNVKSNGCDIWIAGVYNDLDRIYYLLTYDGGITWEYIDANIPTLHSNTATAPQISVAGGEVYITTHDSTTVYGYKTSIDTILNDAASPTLVYGGVISTAIYDTTVSESYNWYAGGRGGDSLIIFIDTNTGLSTDITGTNTEVMRAIHAYDDDNVLVGGDNGVVLYSNSFGVFQQTNSNPVTNTGITSVQMLSPTDFLVATNAGIYCSGDSGNTWRQVTATNGTTKLMFYDEITGYAVASLGTYRTIDGGNTWTFLEQHVLATPRKGQVCPYNPNKFMIAGGGAGNGWVYTGSN